MHGLMLPPLGGLLSQAVVQRKTAICLGHPKWLQQMRAKYEPSISIAPC